MLVVLVALTATTTLTGCSGSDGPADPAAVVSELQEAFADDDDVGICERMSDPAQWQAGEVAHNDPTTCERDVRRVFKMISAADGWGQTTKPPVVRRTRLHGDRATVRLEHQGDWEADIPLKRTDGTWKLAGFFGSPPGEFEQLEKDFAARPFPTASGQPIQVVNENGKACPEMSAKRYPQISGGCAFDVIGHKVPVLMLTPFGDFRFADCAIGYRVRVDGTGRTQTIDLDVNNEEERGCSDVKQCVNKNESPGYQPWKGRLVSDGKGGYQQHMDICLRTCIGLFSGDFVMRLARHGKGWRVEPSKEGDSGVKFDGDLAVKGAFAIHAGSS